MKGWRKLHRRILNHEIYRHPRACLLFLYLVLQASGRPSTRKIGESHVPVERGQWVGTLRELHRNSARSGPFDAAARSRMRRDIQLLVSLGLVSKKTVVTPRDPPPDPPPDPLCLVITVCQFSAYQGRFRGTDPPPDPPPDPQEGDLEVDLEGEKKSARARGRRAALKAEQPAPCERCHGSGLLTVRVVRKKNRALLGEYGIACPCPGGDRRFPGSAEELLSKLDGADLDIDPPDC